MNNKKTVFAVLFTIICVCSWSGLSLALEVKSISLDQNKNSNSEIIFRDYDSDGYYETFILDDDDNGIVDMWGADTNKDKNIESVDMDQSQSDVNRIKTSLSKYQELKEAIKSTSGISNLPTLSVTIPSGSAASTTTPSPTGGAASTTTPTATTTGSLGSNVPSQVGDLTITGSNTGAPDTYFFNFGATQKYEATYVSSSSSSYAGILIYRFKPGTLTESFFERIASDYSAKIIGSYTIANVEVNGRKAKEIDISYPDGQRVSMIMWFDGDDLYISAGSDFSTALELAKRIASPSSSSSGSGSLIFGIVAGIIAVFVLKGLFGKKPKVPTAQSEKSTQQKSVPSPPRPEIPSATQPTPQKPSSPPPPPNSPSQTSAIICPRCNTPLKEGKNFCPNCGWKSETPKKPKFCPSCSDAVEENEKFCDNCGAKIR